MDADAKKTALRMIPYGLYVIAAVAKDGRAAASTINWVTQASFAPPLIAVGVKADSHTHAIIEETGEFVLNMIAKGDNGLAFNFFKAVTIEGSRIGDEPFTFGAIVKAPVLDKAPAHLECRVVESVKKGDHTMYVAEVVEAQVKNPPSGRADDAVLWLKELGEKVYYGG